MEELTVSGALETATGYVTDLLKVGLDTIGTLMKNEWVLLFFGFTLVMWGVKLFHSIRKTI